METPTFVCSPCNFSTTLRPNYNRHCNTAKHIKTCECEVFTEIKVVSKQDENSILIKMEELMKKNESLEKTVSEMKSTIDILVNVVNNLASSISGSNSSVQSNESYESHDILLEQKTNEIIEPVIEPVIEPLNNEVIESVIEMEKPVLMSVVAEVPEVKTEKAVRKKNKIVLLPEDPKEVKEVKVENKEEQLRIQLLELQLKEMKGKLSEKPEDIIEESHKYMNHEVKKNKRKKILEIDTIYGLCENISLEYLPDKNDEEPDFNIDYTDEYINLIIKFLKSELSNLDEDKRPIVYYKKQLYIRKIIDVDGKLTYQWCQIEINEFINIMVNTFYEFYSNLDNKNETMTYFMNHSIKKNKDCKHIIDQIMPYILMK